MLRIKEMRLERNLTQGDLAKNISSTSKSIWAYENQVAVPPLDVLIRLADFFGCSLDYLTGREDDFGAISITGGTQLPAEAQELVDIYTALEDEYKAQILQYARYFAERRGIKIKKV